MIVHSKIFTKLTENKLTLKSGSVKKTTKVQQWFSKKQEFCGIAVKKKIKININPGFQKSCSSLSHKTLANSLNQKIMYKKYEPNAE